MDEQHRHADRGHRRAVATRVDEQPEQRPGGGEERLVHALVHASEDVGLADPTALLAASAAAQAVALIGLPEARINLAQATIHLVLAPKSNAVVAAINAAQADVRAGRPPGSPALRDGSYPGAARLGHAQRYRYPHDAPEGVVSRNTPPTGLSDGTITTRGDAVPKSELGRPRRCAPSRGSRRCEPAESGREAGLVSE